MIFSASRTAFVARIAAALLAVSWLGAAGGDTDAQPEPTRPGFPIPNELPRGPLGEVVRFGEKVFVDTPEYAKAYVGNGLTCANCHLDRGRLGNASPMWAVFGTYPRYREKTHQVDTLEHRLQDCFRYSMNGKAPETDSPEMVGLVSYIAWLSTGAPVGRTLDGQGYPALAKPAVEPSIERGKQIFAADCALCHGDDGAGRKVAERYVFPPLWGPDSYNWGAGMHRVSMAAAFIKANMPLGGSLHLTDQQAWDVAAFVNSHPRPQDPRFTGSVAETRQKYHGADDFYGREVDNTVLGSPGNLPR